MFVIVILDRKINTFSKCSVNRKNTAGVSQNIGVSKVRATLIMGMFSVN